MHLGRYPKVEFMLSSFLADTNSSGYLASAWSRRNGIRPAAYIQVRRAQIYTPGRRRELARFKGEKRLREYSNERSVPDPVAPA